MKQDTYYLYAKSRAYIEALFEAEVEYINSKKP
jgi:hypothetical protein